MFAEDSKKFLEILAKLEAAKVFQDAPTVYGDELVKLVNDTSNRLAKNDPDACAPVDYSFSRYVHKCGESLLIKILERRSMAERALKIARTKYNTHGSRWVMLGESGKANDFSVGNFGNECTARFLRGAKKQKDLNCVLGRENGIIPQVYEISQYPLYFIMEWICGNGLLAWSQDKTIATLLRLFSRFLRLVGELHANKIVHGDIKPANIIVAETTTPTPALLDFTVAKDYTRQEESVTKIGTPIYSDNYASPVVISDARRRTPFDDIFALGKTLIALYFRRELGDRRLVVSEIEDGLRVIVERAIQPDPRSRYRTIAAFSADLDAYIAGIEHTEEQKDDVIFDDSELSDNELMIVKLLHAGMVKISHEESF